MELSLKYGNSKLKMDVPDENYRGTLVPRDLEQVAGADS